MSILQPEQSTLVDFGIKYARAWCSQTPEKVAAFFAETGSLTVNNEAPAIGRNAIKAVAREFMTTFPDMKVTMDKMERQPDGAVFHWTLTGTNNGPGGNGNPVRISGSEVWRFDANGLVAESRGQFDAADYNRQLESR